MTPHPPASEFSWNDGFLLGYPPMDGIHEEFVGLVGAMKVASDKDLPLLLDRFARHARDHFDAENAWMAQTGFPARDCHVGEHEAVLASVLAVQQRLIDGDSCESARRLVQHLEAWFPGHADHLDSALSHWMCKLRWGGKPVVIRRNIKTAAAGPAHE